MQICPGCGANNEDHAEYCVYCGAPLIRNYGGVNSGYGQQNSYYDYNQSSVNPYYNQGPYNQGPYNQGQYNQGYNYQGNPNNYYQGYPYMQPQGTFNPSVHSKAISKMRSSATLWTVVAILQIIFGIIEIIAAGYGVVVIIVAIWNLKQSSNLRNNANYFSTNPQGLARQYSGGAGNYVLFFFINLFLGSVIGIIGCIYDWSVYNYIHQHRYELL